MAQPNKEVCSIRIMFPVESDEQVMELKKRISSILSELPKVQMQFTIVKDFSNGTQVQ